MSAITTSRAFVQIDQLIRDLEIVFQTTLDRLESQAREAILMDKAIKQILSHDNDHESVLNWHPEKAISPHGAFKALANQIIQAAQSTAFQGEHVSPIDYEDLLSWPDEPTRLPGENPNAELLRRIHYARGKSLTKFWHSLSVRVSPDRNPDAALISASQDLVHAFSVRAPNNLLLPFRDQTPYRTLLMPFNREPQHIEWTIHDEALLNLTRANHALTTLCRINADPVSAKAIQGVNEAALTRLKANFKLYRPDERFGAGDLLQLRFGQHHIDFRLGEKLWPYVWDALPSNLPDLAFIDSPPGI